MTQNNISKFQILAPLKRAKYYAYMLNFKQKQWSKLDEKYKEQKELVGQSSAFWNTMSIVGIILVTGLAIYEAYMTKTALLSFLDPTNKGFINDTILIIISLCLAVLAVAFGHSVSEGLIKDTNPITGVEKYKFGVKFFIAILASILYVYFQYYLSTSASDGSDELGHLSIVAIVVAVLEILTGLLLLDKSLAQAKLYLLGFRMLLKEKTMSKYARKTLEQYEEYILYLNAYNESTDEKVLQEQTSFIEKAYAYYTGDTYLAPKPKLNGQVQKEMREKSELVDRMS